MLSILSFVSFVCFVNFLLRYHWKKFPHFSSLHIGSLCLFNVITGYVSLHEKLTCTKSIMVNDQKTC